MSHKIITWNRAGVAILISDKEDFRVEKITRDYEGHCILIKDSVHEREVTILHAYVPKNRADMQKLAEIKREMGTFTVLIGEFNAHHWVVELEVRLVARILMN